MRWLVWGGSRARVAGLAGLACAGCAVPDRREGPTSPPAIGIHAPAPGADASVAASPTPSRSPSTDAGADVHAGLDADATVLLPIAARAQAPESPPSGWCGETTIQEGLLHLGVWAPQRLVNAAGRPAHPDLYSPEMPVALAALGVRYAMYGGGRGYAPFAVWARTAIDEGDPVIAGVKILPTEHPEWALDHFVTLVGYGPKGFLVNTTWGRREWVSNSSSPGLSLHDAVYGIRLRGLDIAAPARPARLTVLDEREATVTVRVTCPTLGQGARVERLASNRTSGAPVDVTDHATELTLDASRVARFQCVPR